MLMRRYPDGAGEDGGGWRLRNAHALCPRHRRGGGGNDEVRGPACGGWGWAAIGGAASLSASRESPGAEEYAAPRCWGGRLFSPLSPAIFSLPASPSAAGTALGSGCEGSPQCGPRVPVGPQQREERNFWGTVLPAHLCWSRSAATG